MGAEQFQSSVAALTWVRARHKIRGDLTGGPVRWEKIGKDGARCENLSG